MSTKSISSNSSNFFEVNLHPDEGFFVASPNSLPVAGKSSYTNPQSSKAVISPNTNSEPSRSESSPNTNSEPSRLESSPDTNRQPSRPENLYNPIPDFSKIYDLVLLEIGSDLYILRVNVDYAPTNIAEYIDHPVYKVYSSGQTMKENIAEFIKNGGILSDHELRRRFQENEELNSNFRNEELRPRFQENEELRRRFQENEQLDNQTNKRNNNSNRRSSNNISNDSNSKINPTPVNSNNSSFQRGTRVEVNYSGEGTWFPGKITNVNKNKTYNIEYDDGDYERNVTAHKIRLPTGSLDGGMSHLETKSYYNGGGINYTYKTRSYPKNVSFSKKNPYKKTNKKTLRKLQRIIHNA